MSQIAENEMGYPTTFESLQSERNKFAIRFLAIIGIAWGLVILLSSITLAPNIQWVALGAVVTSSKAVAAFLVAVFARRVGMRKPLLVALLSLLPAGTWLALCVVLGFCPEHLEWANQIRMPFWLRLLIVMVLGGNPLALLTILAVLNPAYMLGFIDTSVLIPGTAIPFGLSLLLIGLVLSAFAILSLWIMVSNRLRFVSLLPMLALFFGATLIALWTILLGPAAVQLYKVFGLRGRG